MFLELSEVAHNLATTVLGARNTYKLDSSNNIKGQAHQTNLYASKVGTFIPSNGINILGKQHKEILKHI